MKKTELSIGFLHSSMYILHSSLVEKLCYLLFCFTGSVYSSQVKIFFIFRREENKFTNVIFLHKRKNPCILSSQSSSFSTKETYLHLQKGILSLFFTKEEISSFHLQKGEISFFAREQLFSFSSSPGWCLFILHKRRK